MVKIENCFNNIHNYASSIEKNIEEAKRDMEQSEIEYNKPFQYENELKEKLARQSELDTMLDLGNKLENREDVKQETVNEGLYVIQEDNENREYTGNSYVAERQDITGTGNGYYKERKIHR